MKKLISFIILLALCITLFGCAKAPIDSASPDLLVENKVQDPAPVTDEPQPEQTPDEPTAKTPPSKTEDNEPESVTYKPLEFDIDDSFTPYDVVVTLTVNESAKGVDYTVGDFPGLDVFNVFEYSEYYPEQHYPHLKNNKTLVLSLNEPSKERVLEYCDILEKDPRVQFARPNIENVMNFFEAKIDEDLYKRIKENYGEYGSYTKVRTWFKDIYLSSYKLFVSSDGKPSVYFYILQKADGSMEAEHIYEQIKNASKNEYIKEVIPHYTGIDDLLLQVTLTDERQAQKKDVEMSEFPGIELQKIVQSVVINSKEYKSYDDITLVLKTADKKNIVDAMRALEENGIVKKVSFNYLTKRTVYGSSILN